MFESGAILLYLAEKFGAFVPPEPAARAECYSWLMWQMGSAPYLGGGFGHFYAYAPTRIEYAIDRYAMEAKRLFHVADTQLAQYPYLAGEAYTLADIAAFPWLAVFFEGTAYNDVREFLSLREYPNLKRWVERIAARPAVVRGRQVNMRKGGLRERHAASDFEAIDAPGG